MKLIRYLWALSAALLLAATLVHAEPRHGIAMHGEPALPPEFKHLPYVNPDAPKGGALRQAVSGSFDSVNPFIVKGQAVRDVRTFVFESLLGRNWDEPFSLYGLLAESIDVSPDRQTFAFKLRPEAKFSDGSPVTSSDVKFSMEILRDKGRPNFKNSYGKVTKVETPDARTITFQQEAGDLELPLIIGVMPILQAKSWENRAFDESTLEAIIGSGPYTMGEIKAGVSITYRKNPGYWAKDLPLVRGLWNFDSVRFDYYRDANAAFEAFKKGDADVRTEGDPVRWTSGYDFPAAKDGKVVLEKIEQRSPSPASGFAFNTRREIFSDPRVREALIMAFDFEWANANLFSNAYRRTYGYYSGSELSSRGQPASAAELDILGGGALREDFKSGAYELPLSDGSGRDRKVLRKAVALLGEAGWKVMDGVLQNGKGEPFAFTLTIQNKDQEKIALHYQRTLQQIGIAADVRVIDNTQFTALQRTYDYDMIPVSWFNSLSPGNEQKLYFGSEGRTVEGTRNYPGIADPSVDKAIDALLVAKSREDFVAAARLIDRLLVSGFYIIPFYDAGGQWVARWNYIGRLEKQPLPGFEATTLWRVQ